MVLDLTVEARGHEVQLTDLPELSDDQRAMAARTWRGRMVNEHVSAQVFASLVPQLMRAGIRAGLQATVPAMIADEYRHAEQCAAVVVALGHNPVARLPPIEDMPQHTDVSPLEAVLRNVISVCCMSETVAVAVISAEHFELQGTELGRVLQTILADEINHARFGWTLLGELHDAIDAAMAKRLTAWIKVALKHQIMHEIPKLPLNAGLSPAVSMAGVCDGGQARALFVDTVESVIVPGLEEAGFGAREAWEQVKREL